MNKFEDLFYELKGKAKDMYGAASKATSEAVDYGKVRYNAKQTQWEIEKTYAKLGEVCYETQKGATGMEDAINLAVEEIDRLKEKLDELEANIRAYKNVGKCPACGKENDNDACFCARCGAKLEKPEAPPAAETEE